MANYWLVVGIPDNWKEAFKRGNIWGLKPRQRKRWERLAEGDIILFYATKSVAGVIGYGLVRTKFIQDKPLWPDEMEKGEVLWPLRLEFDVEYCLPPDRWETERITSDTLKLRVAIGFQAVEPRLAEQVIAKFKELAAQQEEQTDVPLHRELQQKVLEIGKLQKYITEKEYPFDIGKLDVVWRRIEGSAPTYVFEIQIGGDIYHALAKLKHAYDLWNSHIFLVAPQADRDRATRLLAGTFHEINQRIKIIDPEQIEELYKRKRSYLDLERQLGITL